MTDNINSILQQICMYPLLTVNVTITTASGKSRGQLPWHLEHHAAAPTTITATPQTFTTPTPKHYNVCSITHSHYNQTRDASSLRAVAKQSRF
eukprot:gene10093-2261_t